MHYIRINLSPITTPLAFPQFAHTLPPIAAYAPQTMRNFLDYIMCTGTPPGTPSGVYQSQLLPPTSPDLASDQYPSHQYQHPPSHTMCEEEENKLAIQKLETARRMYIYKMAITNMTNLTASQIPIQDRFSQITIREYQPHLITIPDLNYHHQLNQNTRIIAVKLPEQWCFDNSEMPPTWLQVVIDQTSTNWEPIISDDLIRALRDKWLSPKRPVLKISDRTPISPHEANMVMNTVLKDVYTWDEWDDDENPLEVRYLAPVVLHNNTEYAQCYFTFDQLPSPPTVYDLI